MKIPKSIYKLEKITDNPLFEGFAFDNHQKSILGRDRLSEDFEPDQQETCNWTMTKLANRWKPARVIGRVAPFNDYPCVGMLTPAFSQRAASVLREFLEPNGELLPLLSEVGDYYVYNLSRKADVLNVKDSDVEFWCEPPTTAVEIEYFSFYKSRLKGLSIFRLPEIPNYVFVTDAFVERVHQHGLNGFHFIPVWPLKRGVNWRLEEVKRRRKKGKKIATPKGAKEIKGNTVVVILMIKKSKPSAAEEKQIARYEDELDAQLVITSLESPYFGSLEGRDITDGECRLFLSCPDADNLVQKLWPWLTGLDWTSDVHVMKRYGNLHDAEAPEELVDLP